MEIPAEVERLVRERRYDLAVERLCHLTGVDLAGGRRAVQKIKNVKSAGSATVGHPDADSPPPYKLIAVAVILIGGILTVVNGYEILMSLRAVDWPSTEGVIVHSETRRVSRRSNTASRTKLIIRYEYAVDGRRYTGDRVAYARAFDYAAARRAEVKYRVDRRVPVYYHPRRPSAAVLERGSPGFHPSLAVGFFLLLLGFWVAYKAKRGTT